jgi:branched-chain amino acid transport system substrate-binding protein
MRTMLAVLCALLGLMGGPAQAQAPITIGFGMALTGGLAPIGKAALLAMQIWEEETNAKGGLLGRPVKLVYYDDQSNPATVPGIYTKLLDVDHVDWWSAAMPPTWWRPRCRSSCSITARSSAYSAWR